LKFNKRRLGPKLAREICGSKDENGGTLYRQKTTKGIRGIQWLKQQCCPRLSGLREKRRDRKFLEMRGKRENAVRTDSTEGESRVTVFVNANQL